jgi:DNA primase
MQERDVLMIVEALGAAHVEPGPENVNFSCVLAPWTHKKGTDRHPSMGISHGDDKPSLVNCFGCGFGGTVGRLVDELERHSGHNLDELRFRVIELEEDDQFRALDNIDDYDVVPSTDDDDGLLPGVLYEKFSLTEPAVEYMQGRGFSSDTLHAWGIGFDRKRQRVTFPLRDRSGRLAGAHGRTIENDPLRWYTYWNAKKARHLFGAQLVIRSAPHIVVVEGQCDALRVWQETRGFAQFQDVCPVAIMGSKPSRRQVELICSASACTFFLDNDEAGTTGTHILADTIAPKVPSWVARYPDDRKDPDSLGVDVVEALLQAEMI